MMPAQTLIIPLPAVNATAAATEFKIARKVKWQKLAVHISDEIRFIPYDEIMYCTALNNYTKIFTRNGKSLLCTKTLKEVEKNLPDDQFIRIHNSYLVNIQEITAMKKGEGTMEISHNIFLPVSRNMKKYLSSFLCGC